MFGSRYLALQLNHAPLQVEQRYMEMYPPDQFWDQRIMNAMSTFWDEAIHNVTLALKRTRMWERTLLVMSGDKFA